MAVAASAGPAAPGNGRRTDWVEIFEAGVRRGEPYTPADLDTIVANFRRHLKYHRPGGVIGHEESQPLTQDLPLLDNSGNPAVAWVVDLRRNGRKLEARFSEVFPWFADLVAKGAYAECSAELWSEDDPPEGFPVPLQGLMLRRVAFLGGDIPAVKTLGGIAALAFAEGRGRRVSLAYKSHRRDPRRGTVLVFSEVKFMDRKALEDQLRGVGWSEEAVAALASLSDDDLQKLVLAVLAQQAGATPPAEPAAAAAEMPPRETMIADLVAMGEDPAALEAMDDAALFALWQEKKGAAMSDTAPTTTPATPTIPQQQPASVTLKYAELERRAAALERSVKAQEQEARRRLAAERHATVRAFCERWSREGHVLASEVDAQETVPAGKRVLNLYYQLLNASGVRKFGERSEFDALVASVEARGPGYARRNFSERLAQPIAGVKNKYTEAREAAAAAAAEARKGRGRTLEQRLGLLRPAGLV